MTKPRKITENEFMSQVIQLANLLGWRVYHTHDSRHSTAGFPDLLLLRNKVMIVAELKVGTNQPTTEQRAWLIAFSTAGATAKTWHPDDWSAIEAALRGQGTS